MAGDLAAMFQRMANAVARDGAKAAADAAGNKFIELEIPHVPVRSGALRRSIRMKAGGGGLRSTSHVAPHTVYAAIQNFGGDIHVKHTYTTSTGKVMPGWLSDGGSFFGHSVHIRGSGYWSLAGKGAAIGDAASHAVQVIVAGAA